MVISGADSPAGWVVLVLMLFAVVSVGVARLKLREVSVASATGLTVVESLLCSMMGIGRVSRRGRLIV